MRDSHDPDFQLGRRHVLGTLQQASDTVEQARAEAAQLQHAVLLGLPPAESAAQINRLEAMLAAECRYSKALEDKIVQLRQATP